MTELAPETAEELNPDLAMMLLTSNTDRLWIAIDGESA